MYSNGISLNFSHNILGTSMSTSVKSKHLSCCRRLQNFSTFPGVCNLNAQRPHCHRACHPALCLGTTHDFSTHLCILEFVRTDPRFASLVLSTEDQARPSDNRCFQHFVGFLPWGVQIWRVSLVQRTPLETFHAFESLATYVFAHFSQLVLDRM